MARQPTCLVAPTLKFVSAGLGTLFQVSADLELPLRQVAIRKVRPASATRPNSCASCIAPDQMPSLRSIPSHCFAPAGAHSEDRGSCPARCTPHRISARRMFPGRLPTTRVAGRCTLCPRLQISCNRSHAELFGSISRERGMAPGAELRSMLPSAQSGCRSIIGRVAHAIGAQLDEVRIWHPLSCAVVHPTEQRRIWIIVPRAPRRRAAPPTCPVERTSTARRVRFP